MSCLRIGTNSSGRSCVLSQRVSLKASRDSCRLELLHWIREVWGRRSDSGSRWPRGRAPGRAPQRPTLILATDASTVMGTEMGVVQRIADQGGPLDPEDLASMRGKAGGGMLREDLCTCVVYSVVSTSSE